MSERYGIISPDIIPAPVRARPTGGQIFLQIVRILLTE